MDDERFRGIDPCIIAAHICAGRFFGGQDFFLVKKRGLGLALCLQPPSATLQPPMVTLQPPSVTLQTAVGYPPNRRRLPSKPPSVTLQIAVGYPPTAVGYPLSAIGCSCADVADHRTLPLFFFIRKRPALSQRTSSEADLSSFVNAPPSQLTLAALRALSPRVPASGWRTTEGWTTSGSEASTPHHRGAHRPSAKPKDAPPTTAGAIPRIRPLRHPGAHGGRVLPPCRPACQSPSPLCWSWTSRPPHSNPPLSSLMWNPHLVHLKGIGRHTMRTLRTTPWTGGPFLPPVYTTWATGGGGGFGIAR